MSSTSHQEHIKAVSLFQPHIFKRFTQQVKNSHGVQVFDQISFPVYPIVVKTKHNDGQESFMIHDEFSVIKTGNRHWLISEGVCTGDSPGTSLRNLIALPIKGLHAKEIEKVIERFEKNTSANDLVLFSLEHPGYIAMNISGRYGRAEDEDHFHSKRDQMAISIRDENGNALKEWQKVYDESVVDFHANYLAKLLQRSYRRI